MKQTVKSIHSILDIHMEKRDVVIPPAYTEYEDIFNETKAEALPPHRVYDCPIDLLPGAAIPYGRIYPLSEPELNILKEYIHEHLQKGFIRPSTSPAGAGIFFVGKKDGGLRPCVDYRDLNNITIKNRYPLPLIPELMERLKTAKIFTKLDLKGAYNLLRIRQGDEWKTAFRTRYGHYEYLVMPYGLCNAPATFQHLVNDIFRDLLDICVIVYLDDILVYSDTLQTHRHHMKEVFARLRKHLLYAKREKCIFETNRIAFLGYVLSPGKIEMDPGKIAAILSWPTPTSRNDVQRFLGFANFYRRFIRSFSKLVQPLTDLTKNVPFKWSEQASNAFQTLQSQFTSAPILRLPNPSLPYFLEVDASNKATGAVLSQRDDVDQRLHPIAYFSKRLTPAECNYEVGDRELLAIKKALEEWRHLLEGTSHPVSVFTDHKNLEYLRTAKRLKPHHARWALFFPRFQLHITYQLGSKNGKADALSRLPVPEESDSSTSNSILPIRYFLATHSSTIEKIKQLTCPMVYPLITDGLCLHQDKIVVPEGARLDILALCHDSPQAGHGGIKKTQALLRRYFYWPTMNNAAIKYVTACPVCNRNKKLSQKTAGLLQPLPVPDRPWKDLTVDFIVDLPPSQGCTTIMVVVDRLTKMAHFVSTKGLPTAKVTASLFHKEIFRLHGIPASILSDRGSQFTSRFWKMFCLSLKIHVKLSSAYHPQTNGQTERTNQIVEQYLRCYTCHLQDDWVGLLPAAEFAYNSGHHQSLRESPFFLTYGYHPSLLPDLPWMEAVPDARERLEHLRDGHRQARRLLRQAQDTYKAYGDLKRRPPLAYEVNQKVWLSTRNLRLTCPTKKLGPTYIGPFPITAIISPTAIRLQLPDDLHLHPVFHVLLLKPWTAPSFSSQVNTRPPPLPVDGEPEYEIHRVLDSRYRRRQLQYLIHWRGYGPEERSWEPAVNVHAPHLLRRFHRSYPTKPGPLHPRRARIVGGGAVSCLTPTARPRCHDSRRRLPCRGTSGIGSFLATGCGDLSVQRWGPPAASLPSAPRVAVIARGCGVVLLTGPAMDSRVSAASPGSPAGRGPCEFRMEPGVTQWVGGAGEGPLPTNGRSPLPAHHKGSEHQRRRSVVSSLSYPSSLYYLPLKPLLNEPLLPPDQVSSLTPFVPLSILTDLPATDSWLPLSLTNELRLNRHNSSPGYVSCILPYLTYLHTGLQTSLRYHSMTHTEET
uniref:Gypsy retrotransposon integrase-like protein 1 n=1 Tax=Leptobrachium leishanense TaxID=445787 RepID=A0A8C5LZY7_9ANUR